MGLTINLEGPEYKFTGSVSDIQIIDAVDNEMINQEMNTTDDVQ